MASVIRIAVLLTTTAVAAPLHAATVTIDSFSASTASAYVGDTVQFHVWFSASTTSQASGGSNLNEPEPVEGFQPWNVNWYSWEHESLNSVWLQAAGQSFYDTPGLFPGSGYSSSWSFSITFQQPGQYDIDLSGGWTADINTGYSNENASRNCYYSDPDYHAGLACDAWLWQYGDYSDQYTTSGTLGAGPLRIDVAAVTTPAPAGWALWLPAIGLLATKGGRPKGVR